MPYNLRKRKTIEGDDDDEKPNDDEAGSMSDEEDDPDFDLGSEFTGTTIIECPEIYLPEYYTEGDENFIARSISGDTKRYKQEIRNVREHLVSTFVSLSDILDSAAPVSVKANLLLNYELMIRLNYFEPAFTSLNRRIKDTLSTYKKNLPMVKDAGDTILDKILQADLDSVNKEKIYAKYLHMTSLDPDSYEYNTIKNYITYGLKIRNKPTQTKESGLEKSLIPSFVFDLKSKLDGAIYGQATAKEEIIDNVVNRIVNPDLGNITVLKGEPGVGKTYLVRKLADLLDYKFYHISLGGQNSADKILGSLSVYNSSKPGEIYNAIAEMGCNNGIILLDEFDKITTDRKDVYNAFLNILDPSQNMAFKDNFLHDLNIDLSKIWFILSMNDIDNIDPIVRDRLKNIVHFKSYNEDDKRHILLDYFIPEMKTKYKLDSEITFDDLSINKLIKGEKSGVRDLKHSIDLIYKRLSVLYLTEGSEYKPSYYIDNWREITFPKLEKLLGERHKNEDIPFGMYT